MILLVSWQQVAYPDVAPVMLLSEASVQDLSSKLEKDVTVERFRPNIVIGDCKAFEEVCVSVLLRPLFAASFSWFSPLSSVCFDHLVLYF